MQLLALCITLRALKYPAFKERGTNPVLHQPNKHLGQFKEVPGLEKAIGPLKNGFFIEVGALNGVVYTNTLYFESAHNWTGKSYV